jgi:hypothetical protein
VVCIGVAGGWSVRLSFDEYQFYMPAVRQFERALPRILWADYDFPGPPAALVVQAIIYALSQGSLLALRFFSLAMAIAAFFVSERIFSADLRQRRFGLAVVMAGCFPFFLSATFLIRQHAFTMAGLALGYHLLTLPPSRPRALGAFLALTLATLSNQMCVPFCGLLGLRALSPAGGSGSVGVRSRLLRMLVPAVPIAALAILMLVWQGIEPPTFLAKSVPDAGVGLLYPAQWLIGLLSLGVWVFPALKSSRRTWLFVLVLWLPCAFLVQKSQIYAPDRDFLNVISGPISSVIRHFSRSRPLMAPLLAGVPIACGAAFLLGPAGEDRAASWLVRVYSVLYIAMMSLTPFLFERYYLFLIVPIYWLLARRLTADRTFLPAAAGQAFVALAGLAYAWSKLSEFTF